ncbi:MAG: hypothetical protein C0501_10920 [Isosphaera sp.]|nr:hypothetical protein [Isosphaera sp.]
MSSPTPYEVVPDPAEPDGPDRADGSAELDQRETFALLFNDPAVRTYTIAALAALAVVFLVLFENGSDLGALLVAAVGAAGVFLRWTTAPGFVLVLVTYFMVFPLGLPGSEFESRSEITDGRFRPPDLMLAAAVVVYAAAQFRLYGFVRQAVASEGSDRRPGDPPARRPPALVSANEFAVLLGLSAVAVVLGQLVWWAATGVEVVPGEDWPLRWAQDSRSQRQAFPRAFPGDDGRFRDAPAEPLPPRTSRFVLLVGMLFFTTVVARLVFGYWRLRAMGPAEGAMVVQDGGWLETKRERSRLEKWRAWGRKRAGGDEPGGTG